VGRETGDLDAVGVGDGDCVGDGEGGADVGVGVGVMLSLTEGIGDGCAAGEVCFCGDGVVLGVADSAAFDGAGDGVSDFAAFEGVGAGVLCAPDGDDFDFAAGVGVCFGAGGGALRSTPR